MPDRVIHFAAIDSTNDEARRLAEAGERGPLWLVADRQTAGRGRHGRTWASEPGNLLTTFLFAPGMDAQSCARLSFAAAVGVARMLDEFVPGLARLKWPNDVLIEGKKIAGILLEASAARAAPAAPAARVASAAPGVAWLAIGIGVNLAHAPRGTPFPATALSEVRGVPVTPGQALPLLAASLGDWIARVRREGFAPLRAAWLARAQGLGQPIEVRLAERTLRGRFEGLDDTGALLLRDGETMTSVSAGEVFFNR